jgi:hypothetical protein
MNILDAITLTEKLSQQASAPDHVHSPTIRATRIGSDEFPKIEVQVGPVLFSANNEEIALYVPGIGTDSKLSPEHSLSTKMPLEQTTEKDLSDLLDNTFGLGIVLESIRKNHLDLLGVAGTKLLAEKDQRYFAYDFSPTFQLPGQTLLRVTEEEAKPQCDWQAIPPIRCRPHLVEVMSDQLTTAMQAALTPPQNLARQKSLEQKLEEKTLKNLENNFPDAKCRVQIRSQEEETQFSVLVSHDDCLIEENGSIDSLGELHEASKATGPRHKVLEYQQRLLPIWSTLSAELVQHYEQSHPSPDI